MSNTSTLTDPTFITRDTANNLGVSALDARYGIAGLADTVASSTLGYDTGVFPGTSSGSTILDCRVVQTSSASMTVQISPGNYQVGRAGLGAYLGAVTGLTNATVSGSNGSNPRIDYVILRVREPTVDGTITASVTPMVLAGSPAANPSEATAASQVTDGDLVLGAITVRAGSTSILQGDIVDKRKYLAARGGISVKASTDSSSGSFPGQWRDNLASKTLERWDGSQWQPVANPATWLQYTPRLIASGPNTDIGMGTGAVLSGHYTQVGKMLTLNLSFTWGTGPLNGLYGAIYSYLPPGFVSGSNPQWINCHGYFQIPAGNPTSTVDVMGECLIPANSTQIQPWFPVTIGGTASPAAILATGRYQVASAQGAASTGIPNITNGYPQGGYIHCTGMIEIA